MSDILIIQTAFAGDLVLTTPLIDACALLIPDAAIDVLCIPGTAGLLQGNPRIREVIVYDKHGGASIISLMRMLSRRAYDVCLTPHRSLRSALLARFSRAPVRVSFDTAAGGPLHTHRVKYQDTIHEAHRNLSLLTALGFQPDLTTRPRLYPGGEERARASEIIYGLGGGPIACIAPGSVWATKRWTEEGFVELSRLLLDTHSIALLGGAADRALCSRIATTVASRRCISHAGELSFLASAALIGMCDLLLSNDSAPVHLASAMNTPVIEIYGATSPSFGFTPLGVPHRIVEVDGLSCKPCGIHGGRRCPEKHFSCMRDLAPLRVHTAVVELLRETGKNTKIQV